MLDQRNLSLKSSAPGPQEYTFYQTTNEKVLYSQNPFQVRETHRHCH